MLGLPDGVVALLFDMDGVLTRTAEVHAQAWKAAFDAFLKRHDGEDFTPFDPEADYDEYVDGKPREDGIRDFLASRGITLPEGAPDDPRVADTVHGVGNAKNTEFLAIVHRDGVRAYPGSLSYVRAALEQGLRCAVVSSSTNAHEVLDAAGFKTLIPTVVDGRVLTQEHLAGKPHPDPYLRGARALGADPREAAVFEDALAGVEAGAAGGFGAVIGVNRAATGDHADALAAHGATIVVSDLAELLGEVEVPR
ncbi:MAG TPA: beta-phosphoglucomutase family hydrolase [Solirubrobacteraceae bacterium]|nr:beta-phosphoglucomutase family hydrolase [Solirubrobacteraceae bacterium]